MSTGRDVELASDLLRVRFRFHDDRYAHEVWLADGSPEKCLLRSVEGSPLADWPASPPLQSVHLEQRGEQQLALAVGMAGHSHWSASIELDPAGRSATFDVACRVRAKVAGVLGSSYDLVGARAAECPAAGRILLDQESPAHARLVIEACGPPGQTRLELSKRVVSIGPHSPPSSEAMRTLRWQYRVRLLPDSGGD